MRHQWFTTTGPHDWLMRSRQCANCGAKQKLDVIHYDRMTGTMRAWRPLVGRCRSNDGNDDTTCAKCGHGKQHHTGGRGICGIRANGVFCDCNQYKKSQ